MHDMKKEQKNLKKEQYECWKKMNEGREKPMDICNGEASNQRQFCFVQQKCISCKRYYGGQ